MAVVELRKKNGKWLANFYVRVYEKGSTHVINTQIPWKGSPPASMRDEGDAEFEVSRKAAATEADRIRAAAAEKGDARYIAARIVESKTGRKWKDSPVTKLVEVIADTIHRRQRSQQHETWKKRAVQNFVEWALARKIMTVLMVTPEIAQKYMASFYEPDDDGKIRTAASIRKIKALLGRAMTIALPMGIENPFKGVMIETPEGDVVVNREPLNAVEIDRLLNAASDDQTAFDLIVAGLCTGLRRGDVCRIRWQSVDTRNWTLKITTSKTRTDLYLPVMPKLQEVFERRLADKKDKAIFVFPEAELQLRDNPSGVSRRIKRAFALAFAKPPEAVKGDAESPQMEKLADILPAVLKSVDAATMSSGKRAKMKDLLTRYASGQSYRVIQTEIRISRGGISMLLHEAERLASVRFLPDSQAPGINAAINELTRTERKIGLKAASKYDFHALRTTFVTLALNAGISVDKLKVLTGHSTVEVVLKHYYRPSGVDVARELEAALPSSLTRRKIPRLSVTTTKAMPKSDTASLGELVSQIGQLSDGDRIMLSRMLESTTDRKQHGG